MGFFKQNAVMQIPIFIDTCFVRVFLIIIIFNYKIYAGARNILYEVKNNGTKRERTLVTVN